MKLEPNADMRAFAVMFRQMHVALLDEGFTQAEALGIIGQVICASLKDPK